jgi:serine protease Do
MATGLGFGDLTGVVVSDLEPDGPAERAGLHIQDLIQTIDGMPVENVALFTLSLYLRTTNDKVNLQVMRGNKQVNITVPVVEPRHDISRLAELSDPSKDLIPRLGIIGVSVTPEVAEMVGGSRALSGVLVTATVANRLAVDSGLQEGDIIHSLNRTPIKSLDDLRAAFGHLQPGDPAAMQVERNGRLTYIAFEME